MLGKMKKGIFGGGSSAAVAPAAPVVMTSGNETQSKIKVTKSTAHVTRTKANTNVVAVCLGALAADLDMEADAKTQVRCKGCEVCYKKPLLSDCLLIACSFI